MRYIPYAVVKVFSESPLGGNPIAVVPDVQDLHETEMQQIASEFNLSLTVCIDRSKGNDTLAHLRFFTPTSERMFSGKGTLAAWKPFFDLNYCDIPVAEADGLLQSKNDTLQFISGSWENKTEVVTQRESELVTSVSVTMPPAEVGDKIEDFEQIGSMLGADAVKMKETGMMPCIYKVGGSKLYVAVPTDADLGALNPSPTRMRQVLSQYKVEGIYAFSLKSVRDDKPIRSRGFYPLTGVDEDKASGSAVAGLFAYLVDQKQLASGDECPIRVQQGFGENNESVISASGSCENVEKPVVISGAVTLSRKGTLVLP